MTTANIIFDTSELNDLDKLLTTAAGRVDKVRSAGLARAAESVRDQAAATVRSYPHATGALANDLHVAGTPLTKTVGSTLREAFFLEFGSPTTGGPRPFLTGPARTEITHLLEELGKAGMPG
jgi:hypothetical protein